mgnify:FL=1
MALPKSQAWLVNGFCRYAASMVRSKFTCFAVQFEEPPELLAREGHAMVVFANHVGWWDPIVAMLLRKAYFPSHTLFAPIDAKALEAYGIFRSLGFYGIQLDRLAGAAEIGRAHV